MEHYIIQQVNRIYKNWFELVTDEKIIIHKSVCNESGAKRIKRKNEN